jgi:hypothetical protein
MPKLNRICKDSVGAVQQGGKKAQRDRPATVIQTKMTKSNENPGRTFERKKSKL